MSEWWVQGPGQLPNTSGGVVEPQNIAASASRQKSVSSQAAQDLEFISVSKHVWWCRGAPKQRRERLPPEAGQ